VQQSFTLQRVHEIQNARFSTKPFWLPQLLSVVGRGGIAGWKGNISISLL